jgi:hypothetical protein
MSEFQNEVATLRKSSLAKFKAWEKEQSASDVLRDRLNQEGRQGKMRLDNLIDKMESLALDCEDPEVNRKAAKDLLELAAGNVKVGTVNNNQYNLGNFLTQIKEC